MERKREGRAECWAAGAMGLLMLALGIGLLDGVAVQLASWLGGQ
jgi:hypothetical protein